MAETLPAFASALLAAGFGVDGQTFFSGSDVDVPPGTLASAPVISVVETGGEPDAVAHDGNKIAMPWFQITVRHARYPNASALIHQIHAWANKSNVTLGGKFWLWIRPVQRPFPRGQDASSRTLISFNVRTAVRD